MPAPPHIRLVRPNAALLPAYAAALERGWSPSTTRDVSGEQLAALRADPRAFVDDLTSQEGLVTLDDGRRVPRLPNRLFWIADGDFAGSINLRFQRGTEELPPHCSGHVGYGIVPWKRRRGYATRALALLLPIAHAEGLARVLVTCDDGNAASRKVIEANGGAFAGTAPDPVTGVTKLLFWITL